MSTTYVGIAESVCSYLASISSLDLTAGVNLFAGLQPDEPDTVVSVFERPGIEMEYLGPVEAIGRHKCRAVAIPVTAQQLANVRSKTGITQRVLRFAQDEGDLMNVKAA